MVFSRDMSFSHMNERPAPVTCTGVLFPLTPSFAGISREQALTCGFGHFDKQKNRRSETRSRVFISLCYSEMLLVTSMPMLIIENTTIKSALPILSTPLLKNNLKNNQHIANNGPPPSLLFHPFCKQQPTTLLAEPIHSPLHSPLAPTACLRPSPQWSNRSLLIHPLRNPASHQRVSSSSSRLAHSPCQPAAPGRSHAAEALGTWR